MDSASPPQPPESPRRGAGQQASKRRMKYQSYRRQSAPSLVLTKALTRSRTLSRESFQPPVCPESCSLVHSFLAGFDRAFLLHGHVQLRTGMQTQDRHLFLFTDVLVISKAKSANHFKQKAQVRVCQMWTAGYMDEVCEGSMSPERSFVMGWPTCNYVATFRSTEDKEKWLSRLKSRIREEKESEEPKTIPLRVYGKGINTFAVTKTLPVSNWDSTNEVVRLALQQFGIIGNVKDFQLWVISKKDNVPYPLIGHEFPFSIQMSHVIQSLSQRGEGRDTAAPPVHPQLALQMEQLQAYKHCQFILKPRPSEPPPLPAGPPPLRVPEEEERPRRTFPVVSSELPQKPLKRRRSFMGWAFWRGSSPHPDHPGLSTSRGCLFGQPLSRVCVEDALPRPVMDMLAFLYTEGSWTRGIFRRPAGARAVRELRDTLDSGTFELPLTRDHVFVIAGVFKDFLRSIPGSLMCCELHGEWTDVLDEEEEEEEQVQDIKRMMARLPKENALLLRYLLAVLHGIQGNAQENQMTSFNLSVCIAPSMLWPPGAPCSTEAEGEGTRKVCELVKFMIEHCQQILGDDLSSLFGGPPRKPSPEGTGPGSKRSAVPSFQASLSENHPPSLLPDWLDPMTDSSYDSLEKELDQSSGSPGSSRGRLRAETLQGSLDSILTLSDGERDADPESLQARPGGRRRLEAQPLARHRARRLKGGLAHLSRETPAESRERRRSEPALTCAARFGPSGVQPASPSSSLSSISPDPNRSSLDSPDSLDGDGTWESRRGLCVARSPAPSTGSPHSSRPRGPQPKEPPRRGPLRGCQSLHPNSWLKQGRRLSLTQQDNLGQEEEACGAGGHKSLTLGKQVSDRGKAREKGGDPGAPSGRAAHSSQRLRRDSSSPPPHHRSAGSLAPPAPPRCPSSESLQPGQSPTAQREPERPAAVLRPPVAEPCGSRLRQRRGSEPGRQLVDSSSGLTRARLPSDPGLKGPQAPPQARLCLSPCTTKAVRDYFCTYPSSHPHSGQQVALALVETRRQWLKRCNDPTAEADFEQLLFAEESYV